MPAEKVTAMKPKHAARTNPHFFEDPNVDRMVSMMMDLAAEISVLRERLDTHERLAEAKGAYTQADIESYEPSDDVRATRDAWRNKFIDRLMKRMEQEYEPGL